MYSLRWGQLQGLGWHLALGGSWGQEHHGAWAAAISECEYLWADPLWLCWPFLCSVAKAAGSPAEQVTGNQGPSHHVAAPVLIPYSQSSLYISLLLVLVEVKSKWDLCAEP